MFYFFFWFFKNCEPIRDSSLWRSNFIPSVRDSIIIIRLRSVTYTFGSRFAYKRWVRVFYQNLNFNLLGQIFQYYLLGLKACQLRFTLLSEFFCFFLGNALARVGWKRYPERKFFPHFWRVLGQFG